MLKHTIREAVQRFAPRVAYEILGRRTWVHEAELALVDRFAVPDGVAADVGANKGVYVHRMARRFARVRAYEPHPGLARYLARAVPRNVAVRPCAVSDHAGIARLAIPVAANLNELSTVEHVSDLPGEVRLVDVPTCRLDDEGFDRLDFLKIDVEGHEAAALAGAGDVLLRCRPVVMVEAEERHRAGAIASIVGFFRERGYAAFVSDAADLVPIARFDLARDQNAAALAPDGARIGRYLNNFVFVPLERAGEAEAGPRPSAH